MYLLGSSEVLAKRVLYLALKIWQCDEPLPIFQPEDLLGVLTDVTMLQVKEQISKDTRQECCQEIKLQTALRPSAEDVTDAPCQVLKYA